MANRSLVYENTLVYEVKPNRVVPASISAYRMRSNMRYSLVVPRTLNQAGDLAFSVAAPRLWNTFNQNL